MKKLIVAAVLAGSMATMAEEAKTDAVAAEKVAIPVAAEQTPNPVKRGPLTDEQRAEMRARHMKMMEARKAEMEKKAVEIIKKYGLDEEKAKALYAELQTAMRPTRRPRPAVKPAAQPAAQPALKAE